MLASAAMPALRDLTAEERVAYFQGVQPIWGGGLAEPMFVTFQRRLADSPEARDRYRLLGLFEGGSFLSAMKAYELEGRFAGQPLRLLGIGAVFTPPHLRRQGFAAAMLSLSMDEYAHRGCGAAVLFSDIGGEFYQRLGFRALESRECLVESSALPRPAGGFRAVGPGEEGEVSALLARGRDAGERLTLSRDGWTLRLQLRRLRELARARGVGEPEWGLRVEGRGGDAVAMIRLGRDTLDLLDAAWTSDAARGRLLGALRDCMARSGRSRLRLWPAHQLREHFAPQERAAALAMVAPLRDGVAVPASGDSAELALLDHI
jgi:hypothetical protein